MYNILLAYTLKMQKFYVNPIYLQTLQAQICGEDINLVNTTIYDVNANSFSDELKNILFDVIIFDTPEGSSQFIIERISSFKAKHFLLVGDIVKYGQLKEFLSCIQKNTNVRVYACIDDNSINGELVNALCQEKDLERISGLAYIEDGNLHINNIENVAEKNVNTFVKFTDSIIHSYEDRGIQVFLDGVSRGCTNSCSFCKLGNNPLLDYHICWSHSDIIFVIKDFQSRCQKKMFIQFTDENFFGGGIEKLKKINNLAERLNCYNFKGYIGIDSRLDSVIRKNESKEQAEFRKSVWEKMFQNGLKYCFLGIESFNNEQSARYNKQLDLSSFSYVIEFFNKNHIYFTVGLILWDPLMSVEELKQNLNFIKEHSLIGKTASLLKILRIQVNSQYWKTNRKNLTNKKIEVEGFFNIDKSVLLYKDFKIRNIIQYVQTIYSWFNDSGYRHSDVALFEVILEKDAPLILREIPNRISQMEFDVLQYLLSIDVFNAHSIYLELKNICLPYVQEIIYELKYCEMKHDNSAWSIYYYFCNVFQKIIVNTEKYFKI